MPDNNSLPTPANVLTKSTISPEQYPSGARFSQSTSDTVSTSNPVTDKERSFTTSDGIDKESEQGLGPSAFEGTSLPYLARLFEMGSQEILQLGLRDSLKSVDSFVLALVKERNWVDTSDSYKKVLAEIKENLGIHPNLQPLLVLERLTKGVGLLRLQKLHRRRDIEISRAIIKLNKQNAI